MGSKFDLPSELQETLVIHAKEFAPAHKKRTKKWLAIQFEARQRAEEVKLNKNWRTARRKTLSPSIFWDNTTLPVVGKLLLRREKIYITK
jgi:hypothetical protein